MGALKLSDEDLETFPLHEEFFENYTSEHTKKSYATDLIQFIHYLKTNFPKVIGYKKVERKHVIKFRNWLEEAGGRDFEPCAPKSMSRKLASLSSYFDFLVERDRAEMNPVNSVKRPRREVISPTNALNREQVQDLLRSIDTRNGSGKLHYALLLTFFTTGLRKSEVLFLKKKHFKEINQHTVLQFRGKGGKQGHKVLHPDTVEAIFEYMDWMAKNGREHESQDWLFQPTKNPSNPENLNKPLNPKTINEILDKYAKKIGLTFKISPHSARATFIGELLEKGVDIYRVAQEVNHSSVKTTQEYDKRKKSIDDSPIYKLDY